MKQITININGEAYPCRPTMGAMLRFKQETGKEITQIDPSSFTELCTYLWCCIVSASKKEGKAFNLSLMDFADSIEPDEMQEWSDALNAEAAQAEKEENNTAAGKKKKR